MVADNSTHVRVRGQLICRDLQTCHEAWDWLNNLLEPGLRAGESEFRATSAQDVIQRNQGRSL